VGLLRDVLVQPPDTAQPGVVWIDSGTMETCRDGVQLYVSGVRTFRISALASGPEPSAFAVFRDLSLSLRGDRTRGDDTTRVTGTGSGQVQYLIDSRTGAVLEASGWGRLAVSVRARSRSERAVQTTGIRIALRRS
jgi:hypothetical protein